jgi:peptide chain release factor 1
MRVPPTERKGRVHTSTVTVAVFEGHLEPAQNATIHPSDIHERITRGTGAGGQNRNKRETVVVLKHIPTGIEVKAESERTQEANRRVAMGTLAQRVAEHYARTAKQQVDQQRRTMLGAGERSDKIRTYRPDGVTDHRTNGRAPLKQVQAGQLGLLWND